MLSDSEKRVLDLIDRGRDDVIQYLSKLISFRTVTPAEGARAEGDDYHNLQALVAGTLKEMSFSVEQWEADSRKLEPFPGSGASMDRDLSNEPIVVGIRKGAGEGRSLILNGHYDVVSPGLRENWTDDPFKAVIRDGRLYGRGSNDMKGGVAAMIQAVRFIDAAGVELGGDLTVQTVPDEEMTCMGTLACCQRGYRADAAIVPEPTDMKVLVAMRGNSGGKVSVFGRAGHAEMTQPHWREGGAVNAISKAMKIVQGIEELAEEWRTHPNKQHKFLDPDTIVPTVIKGGEWEVTYPERVDISFDCVMIPKSKNIHQEIQQKIQSIAEADPWMREHPPKVQFSEWCYGAEVSEDEPIVQTGVEALKDLGHEGGLAGFGSLTDAIHLINYSKIPTISIGPSLKTAHMADEFVRLEELIDTTKAIALSIMRWCR